MILLIDNYDSFVFNVKHYIQEFSDEEVLSIRNDAITLEEIKRLKPSKIVLSPGPKHPKDSGICLEILKADLNTPILGICLGHQAIGYTFGSTVLTLETPMHGKSSAINILNPDPLFHQMPSSFEVMRYHSLYVDEKSPELEVLARSDDGVVMALKHKTKSIFGIQFHPESYFTQYGKKIIENFIKIEKKEEPAVTPKNLTKYLIKLQDNIALDNKDYEDICAIIASKEYEDIQLGALLVLISEKSLYADSLASLVRNILKYSQTYKDPTPMLDIVGTGGDRFKTINVSTTCTFILAALGVKVAKHGNKAVTSKSGSSDVLGKINVDMSSSLEHQRELLAKTNLAFFHAPHFHRLVGQVKEVRDRLGIRTVFNILGPLLNPNTALKYQMVGNYHEPVHKLIAQTLQILGREHALVVRGNDGMDEITLCDETKIFEVKGNQILEYTISPEQFGFKRVFHSDIEGGTPEENAKILVETLKGERKDAKFDIVVLNAMFALYTANVVDSPAKAKPIILEAIESGKVYRFYENYMKTIQGE